MNMRKFGFIFAAIGTFVFVLCGFSGCANNDYEGGSPVFGPLFCTLRLYGGDSKGAAKEIFAMMKAIDMDVSTTVVNSPVYKFNNKKDKTPSDKFEISAAAYEMVTQSQEIYQETSGIYNPAIYPLVERWGVSSDKLYADQSKSVLPTDVEIAEMLKYCKYEYLDAVMSVEGKVKKYFISVKADAPDEAKYMQIDFGGYAKGYAADKAVEICRKKRVEYGTINISGNLYLLGQKSDGTKWNISLKDPFEKGDPFCTFKTEEISPVTSGVNERYYKIDSSGTWKGTSETEPLFDGNPYIAHIIDNRNGFPLNLRRDSVSGVYSNTADGVVCATVFAEKSAYADAYAKYVAVMGLSDGIAFLKDKGLRGIIITADGRYAAVGGIELSGEGYSEVYKEYKAVEGYGFL